MTKKKWILLGCIAAVLVLALVAILVLPGLFAEPSTPKKGRKAETALEVILECLIGGQESREAVLLGIDGMPVAVSPSKGLAALLTAKMEYEILSVDTGDETGTASLQIVSPDAMALVEQALAGMESYDAALFQETMAQLLEGQVAMQEYTVEMELVKVDGDWCVVTNAQFSDAITGGLVSRYDQLQQKILEAVAGGAAE